MCFNYEINSDTASLEEAVSQIDKDWDDPVIISRWDGERVTFDSGPRAVFHPTLLKVCMWDLDEVLTDEPLDDVADELIKETLYKII